MKFKSDTAIQLGMDRAMAFNLIAMIGKRRQQVSGFAAWHAWT